MDPPMDLRAYLESVRRWAEGRPDVLGILLVGSWARGQATPQSDVDLVIIADEVASLLTDRNWLTILGDVRQVQEEAWGKVYSLRVDHGEGLEVEYGLTDRSWLGEPIDQGTEAVLKDGVRMVYERGDWLSPLLAAYLAP
jgi:predicted nucleotidyltransferase